MTHAELLVTVLAVGAGCANIAVTAAVARSPFYTKPQKRIQAALVWLIPVVGAVLVGVFLYSQTDNPIFDTRAYPEPDEKARALEPPGSIARPD